MKVEQRTTESRSKDSLSDKQTLLKLYREMLLIRRFEEKTAEMYQAAKIGGFCHLNIGEEASIVGAFSALRPDATCTGYAIKYQEKDEVVMSIFGDGATNLGAFHESLNVAKLWHLPIVFVCVNNLYGMGTSVSRASAVTEIWKKACAYDMTGERVDGMDVCRQLRSTGNRVPILMLTARDAIEDRVAGLEAGADDYLVKPYDVRELQARLRAIIRRHVDGAEGNSLRFGDLVLDADAHGAEVDGRSVELTRTEYQLLELFMLNPRRVLPNELIYDRVWGYDFNLSGNSLRVYIGISAAS